MRLAPPCGVANAYTGKLIDIRPQVNDLALSIIHNCINIFKIFFVHTLWIRIFCLCLVNNQKHTTKMKKYTPIENAFYWIVTSAIVGIGITTLMIAYAFVEWLFA